MNKVIMAKMFGFKRLSGQMAFVAILRQWMETMSSQILK